ncbi:MAG: ornithine carbamoyltransferase [Candidatus Melainabacteria bacterium]|nr:ornithine carbamoyltransferase [Candidatus Melainabacteria bacterium]
MVRHFLSINDVSKEELIELLDKAAELKAGVKNGEDQSDLLKGKSLALIFEKPSLRTRISFEVGMNQMGGSVLVLYSNEIQIGEREARSDVAKVMSRYLDGIMIRTFGHDVLTETAKYSSIPIINGLSDLEHPCQTMADLLTIRERFAGFDGVKVAYIGDGNNTVHSLMLACTKLGIPITVAAPKEHEPFDGFESEFTTIVDDVFEAAKGANVVYTDVWSSMGQERDAQRRKKIFTGYQVNEELLSHAADNAIVLHCLPAHRGEEITAEVIDQHEASILDQAENRLHAQKAILLKLMS